MFKPFSEVKKGDLVRIKGNSTPYRKALQNAVGDNTRGVWRLQLETDDGVGQAWTGLGHLMMEYIATE